MTPNDAFFPEEEAAVPRDVLIWDTFVGAKTAGDKCTAWLALVCSNVPEARAAAVLIESLDAQTFVPIAVWPKVSSDMGRLAGVVEATLRDRRGVVQPAADNPELTHIAYPLMLDQRVDGVVVLETACSESQVGEILREIHWGSAWLANLLGAHELDEAIRGRERLSGVLEVAAIALRQGKFQQSLFEVTNELRQRFACTRVAFGLVDNAAVKVAALSEAATFEKNAPLVKAYTAAMEEAYDQGAPVCESVADRPEAVPAAMQEVDAVPHPQHLALLNQSGASDVLSFPLLRGVDCVGVLTLEKATDTGFSAADRAWLEAFAALAAPIVEQRRAAERRSFLRLADEGKRFLEKLFGPRHLVWKAASTLTVLLLALLVLVHIDYRVSAKTLIEGEVQRVAAAPFEGFIGAAYVRAGDSVKEGQPLAQLDDRELRIEQAKWASERDQFDNRVREAMANHDLTAVQVIGAQLRQSEAQLALVTEKIGRARLVAPYDGIVVSGDLSQQIGSPVESGKKLFEIAPLQSYRVILQVDEREIRHVMAGQSGQLVITGIASDAMPLTVTKVTPVATAQDGKNFFRVEASLEQAPERLRPGMEGIGKIEVGSHRLWWVLTHTFTDWLTLTLWTWLP